MIGRLFDLILYQPLFNALILLYQYLPGHDFGIAIIVLTILIRFLLYPLGRQAIRTQKVISDLQPKIKEIQEKYKDNPEKKLKLTLELYQEAKISPFSSFLPLLVQLPVLIALYRLFWKGISSETMIYLYFFVPNPGTIDPTFLGIVDLAKPSIILAVLAGIGQFIQVKTSSSKTPKTKTSQGKGPDFSQIFQKQMLYFFPAFTVFILIKLPAAIGLYWIVTTLFTLVQQYFIFKKTDKVSNSTST